MLNIGREETAVRVQKRCRPRAQQERCLLWSTELLWISIAVILIASAGKGVGIGLQRGPITATLFTVMVMMTLVTTMAAGPLFEWAWRGCAEVPDAEGLPAR
jgi:hypothetical protein